MFFTGKSQHRRVYVRNDLATLANHVRKQFSVIASAGPHLQNDIAGLDTEELEYGFGLTAGIAGEIRFGACLTGDGCRVNRNLCFDNGRCSGIWLTCSRFGFARNRRPQLPKSTKQLFFSSSAPV